MIAYALRHLKPHEENYPTPDLKFRAMVFVPRIWCLYLYSRTVWNKLNEDLDSILQLRTSYYLQTNDQSERTIQILDDMLSNYIIDFGGSRDSNLALAEFL